jgi:hypothetical protein
MARRRSGRGSPKEQRDSNISANNQRRGEQHHHPSSSTSSAISTKTILHITSEGLGEIFLKVTLQTHASNNRTSFDCVLNLIFNIVVQFETSRFVFFSRY